MISPQISEDVNEMRALRVGMNSLEEKVDQGFENLRTEFKEDIGEVKEVLNEIKNDFISEQKETNQLLKKLIEK